MSLNFKVKLGEQVYDITDVDANSFVGEVKSQVATVTGCAADCQKWIYKGRIVSDQITITDSGIVEGNTVILMKTAPNNAISPTTPQSSHNSAYNNASYTSPTSDMNRVVNPNAAGSMLPLVSTSHFDNGMMLLLSNSDDVVLAAVTLLLKVSSNIIANPMEEKYRRLNQTNPAFKKKVGDISGGSNCMIGLGFRLEGDEWVLFPTSSAWDVLIACKSKLEKFLKKMNDATNQKLSGGGDGGDSAITTPAIEPTTIPNQTSHSDVESPVSAPKTAPSVNPTDILALQQLIQGLAVIQPHIEPSSLPSSAIDNMISAMVDEEAVRSPTIPTEGADSYGSTVTNIDPSIAAVDNSITGAEFENEK